MKFGGKGMIQLMVLLYNWVWKNEYTPSRWREGVVVNLFKKGDKTYPGNYRGITLLNTVGKLFLAKKFTDKWRLSANVKQSALMRTYGRDIDEDGTLETKGLQGFKEKISVYRGSGRRYLLLVPRENKEGLEVYGMLKEGIGFKDYLHGPMDAGTKLKVKFRTGDIGLRERRGRHRTVDDEGNEFRCDCGFECIDRVHVVAECPLYKKEREVYVTELGKIDRTYREMFEAWN
ncbi:unnamed protein product [Ectocarpus sp. CCAP 1310/34]|nr:unnamed protein product [Ectocarpus sp. CCAP 1310/34]